MVEESLEMKQRKQAAKISEDIIRQCYERKQQVQEDVKNLWETAHYALIGLLRQLDSDYMDACQKASYPVEGFDDSTLYHLITLRIQALQEKSRQGQQDNEIDLLRRKLAISIEKIKELDQKVKDSEELNRKLQEENQNLNGHLMAIRQVKKAPMLSVESNKKNAEKTIPQSTVIGDQENRIVNEPDWMTVWRGTKTFERDSAALVAIGETGLSLRPSIIRFMAERLNLAPSNSSLSEAVGRLLGKEDGTGLHLLELIDLQLNPGGSAGGNNPDVIRLTDAGRTAFRLLMGRDSIESEFDRLRRKHSTPEHTILNIQAAEVLTEFGGYQIQDQAPEIQLQDGGIFIPDIVALDRKIGELVFIEVERDTHKDPGVRKRKWLSMFEVSRGNLYVFCDNIRCERSILNEINRALGQRFYNSFLTNLHSLRNGKRGNDGTIWLSVKRIKN